MNTEKPTIAVIGAGHMGRALIAGLLAKNHPCNKIWASDPSPEKLQNLKQQFAIQITSSNDIALQQPDVIILAVKPQILFLVARGITSSLRSKKQKPLVISIAAGLPLAKLQEYLGSAAAIVRCMPNT